MNKDIFGNTYGARIVHGTPISPKGKLAELDGHSFCVSHRDPRDLHRCMELVNEEGILMLDNGAFTIWKQWVKGGRVGTCPQVDRMAFFDWANEAQDECPQAVAVIPDVIEGGTEELNWMEAAWAVRHHSRYTERLMYVWHTSESTDLLLKACRLFNFVAIGSLGEHDITLHRAAFLERLREAKATIDYVEQFYGRRPWIHLMRGINLLKQVMFVDSADSTNIGRNHRGNSGVADMAARIAAPIDAAHEAADFSPSYATSNFTELLNEAIIEEERNAA